MLVLFADDQISFIQILERLGALGLLAILIIWYMRWGHPDLVKKISTAISDGMTNTATAITTAAADSKAAITKVVDEHREEQKACHTERLENAKIARDVAEKASVERDKNREVLVHLTDTLEGVGETLKKLNKE